MNPNSKTIRLTRHRCPIRSRRGSNSESQVSTSVSTIRNSSFLNSTNTGVEGFCFESWMLLIVPQLASKLAVLPREAMLTLKSA